MIAACIVKNVVTFREFYVICIKDDSGDAYWRDMLESILVHSSYLGCTLVAKKMMQAFVDKFFDQTSIFGQSNEIVLFFIP